MTDHDDDDSGWRRATPDDVERFVARWTLEALVSVDAELARDPTFTAFERAALLVKARPKLEASYRGEYLAAFEVPGATVQ